MSKIEETLLSTPLLLKVKIPFWYKPFVRFMPDFWKDLPEEKYGNWTTRVDVKFTYFGPTHKGKRKGLYRSTQRAYLRARWRAFWRAFWTVGTGVEWVVLDADKKDVLSNVRLPLVENAMTEEQIKRGDEYYKEHKEHVDSMVDSTKYGYTIYEEDKNNPMLWKEGHWRWFLNVRK